MRFLTILEDKKLKCKECDTKVDSVVVFNTWNEDVHYVCITCLAKATKGVFNGLCLVQAEQHK